VSNSINAFIVEDDAHSLIAIGSILKDLGITYKRDTSGSSVVSKVRGMFPRPNFILLDMDLPSGDPYRILNDLKADPALASIPVIAIADASRIAMTPQALEAGFAGYMNKPLPRREFGALLERILAGERIWQAGVN
jgi:two-component system cell cycle response regulator DivK